MLTGREAERARVTATLQRACDGRAGTLLVVGPPGMGKTTLLDDAAEQAAALGMTVRRGAAVEAESDLGGAALSSVAGLFGRPRADLTPWDLLTAVADAAAASPLALLLDDAQWFDERSLRALDFVVRRLADDAVAVVLAARPDALPRDALTTVPQLPLEPLEIDAATRLLQTVSPGTPAAAARRIAEALGNVPLALVEAPHLLAPETLSGRVPLPSPLPVGPAVVERYARGLESLPARARLALVVVAADETGDPPGLAAALDECGLGAVDLEPAEVAGLVTLSGGPRFRHPLVRSAVHAGASDAERRRAHEVLALVSRRRGDVAAAARHAAAAAVLPDEAVAAELEAAVPVAAARSGAAAAAAVAERAAALSIDEQARLRRLGRAMSLTPADPRSADHARRILRSSEDPRLRVEAAYVLALEHLPTTEGGALLDELLASPLPEEAVRDALLARVDVAMHGLDLPALESVVARASRTRDDRSWDWRVAANVGSALTFLGRPADAVPLLRRAVAASEGLDPDALALDELFDWATVPAWLGEASSSDPARRARLSAAARRWRATGEPSWLSVADLLLGELARRQGAFARAEAVLQSSLDLGPAIGGNRSSILNRLLHVRAARGDAAGCEPLLAELDRFCDLHDLPWERLWVAYGRGLLLLADGRAEEAVMHLETLRDTPFLGRGARDSVANGLTLLAEALAAAGRDDETRDVADGLERRLRGIADPHGVALVHRAHAVAGSDDPEARFRAAVAAHERSDEPYELARTRLLQGEWLRRVRRQVDARAPLRLALAEFERLEARPWAARARRELEATGETRSSPKRRAHEGLTPQELRIALAAADGLSNTEIAAQVLLSAKTVETHLTRVYRKLGLRSRAGLARALADAGPAA